MGRVYVHVIYTHRMRFMFSDRGKCHIWTILTYSRAHVHTGGNHRGHKESRWLSTRGHVPGVRNALFPSLLRIRTWPNLPRHNRPSQVNQ